MASPVEPLRGCELDRVNDLHAVHERLVDRATLGHLRKTIPLSVSEHPMNRHLCSDPVDPTVGPLVAVQAVVRVARSNSSLTSIPERLMRLWFEYNRRVIAIQAASPQRRSSYGVGPVSVPPAGGGSSPRHENWRACISTAVPAPSRAVTTAILYSSI